MEMTFVIHPKGKWGDGWTNYKEFRSFFFLVFVFWNSTHWYSWFPNSFVTTMLLGQLPIPGFSAYSLASSLFLIGNVLEWPLDKWFITILMENVPSLQKLYTWDRKETVMATRSRALVYYIHFLIPPPPHFFRKYPISCFKWFLNRVFYTFSFRVETWVGLSQSVCHIPLTRVIDVVIFFFFCNHIWTINSLNIFCVICQQREVPLCKLEAEKI